MRVALDGSFLDLPPSGTGTYVRELARALGTVAPDLDLELLAPGRNRRASVTGSASSEAPPDGSAPSLVEPLVASSIGAAARGRLRRLAWEVAGLGEAARRIEPDLLHVPHFAAPIRMPPDLPLVVTIHDVIPLLLPEYRASRPARVRLALARRAVRRARLVLAPSRAAATDIERVLGIAGDRIRVTPEAAGRAYRPATNPAPLREVARRFGVRGRYVFNVGGMDARKNLPLLLEAFARTLPRLAEPVLLVIGGSPHSANPVVFPPLAPVIDRLGLDGKVVLTGFLSPAAKIALYQGADAYVTPSRYEGFGLTALEAMACGVPTIAANRASLPEVVGDGGLLVEPEPDALAAAMIAVLDDPTRRAALRRRGLARAATFSWERTARLTLAAYEEAMMKVPESEGEIDRNA